MQIALTGDDMSTLTARKHLTTYLNSFKAAGKRCNQVYCSTCGGIAKTIDDTTGDEFDHLAKLALTNLSISDYLEFGIWTGYLANRYRNHVRLIYQREAESINPNNAAELDLFLNQARRICNLEDADLLGLAFNGHLATAEQLAMELTNDSLLATVLLCHQRALNQSAPLYCFALERVAHSDEIARIMYNFYRETDVRVRGYVGGGTTKRLF